MYQGFSREDFLTDPFLNSLQLKNDALKALETKGLLQSHAKSNCFYLTASTKKLLNEIFKGSKSVSQKAQSQFMKALQLNQEQAQVLLPFLHKAPYLSTQEGYFHYQASLEAAITVGNAIAPYVDLIWFETAHPNLKEAAAFAKAVHQKHPKQAFHYNCSPSFNWKSHFTSEFGSKAQSKLKTFNHDLAKLGFKSQKITLFGMHVSNQATNHYVNQFQTHNMAGYSALQEEERLTKNRSLEHQNFVGTNLWAHITKTCTGSDSVLPTSGKSATMNQF